MDTSRINCELLYSSIELDGEHNGETVYNTLRG